MLTNDIVSFEQLGPWVRESKQEATKVVFHVKKVA